MAKKVIKEIIIMLLLCLAIILILGILLYEYVPMTKTIPNPVSYTAPEGVEQELQDTSDDVLLSFNNESEEIDSAELNNYERINNYQPGKANPFSSYEESTSTNGENATQGNSSTETGSSSNSSSSGTSSSGATSSSGSSSSSSSNDTKTSGGHFFQDKGTK
mgnify:CR=1 FL=1